MRAIFVVMLVVMTARTVHADPDDRRRKEEVALIAAMGGSYLIVQFVFASDLSATHCRWCDPNSFDTSARNALLWRDVGLADDLGTLSGYVLAPTVATGLLIASGWSDGWRHWFDDLAPIYESAIAVSLLQHVSKFAFARERPFVYYEAPGHAYDENDNTSTWSGHTSLAFSLAVSAGLVANERGYALAPVIWGVGLTIGAATGYLRIASDRHWTSDVLVGAAMGTAVGYVWPRIIRRHLFGDAVIAPTSNGLALAGQF